MFVYLFCTCQLGDILNSFPVLSGIHKSYGKFNLVLKTEAKRFLGLKEFFIYQDMFVNVYFDDEIEIKPDFVMLSSWTHEARNSEIRPIETCRYENWMREKYPNLSFDVDDDLELKFPDYGINVEGVYIGDRWDHSSLDKRRKSNSLIGLNYNFINFDLPILQNCYIIKNSKDPFIAAITGISVLADLLKKRCLIVWNAEDWDPQFRNGDNVSWDNGKDIAQVFKKHYYENRFCELIHYNDLLQKIQNGVEL